MPAERYIGLISGTSMDGIDAVLADFATPAPTLLAALNVPFDETLRTALDTLRGDPDAFPAARLARLHAELGTGFGEAARAVLAHTGLKPGDVRAIGSHGQTVLHRPDAAPPHSLQLGDPARIAAITGIDVVADLRSADLAAGGQGAPLAPLIHRSLLHRPGEARVVVNLGGIANLTLLSASDEVSGFDTGPANCFLDAWYRRHHDGRFDAGGHWASTGRVDTDWLERLLDEPYFERRPPKSTGIEAFSIAWLESRLPADADRRAADIQATLAEFSAVSIARAVARDVPFQPARMLACGGGVHNTNLLARLQSHLTEQLDQRVTVESTAAHGLDPDAVEGILMAWLAREFVAGRAVDTRAITGARHPVRLGACWPAA
ncbi:MAG: anhydro-N-acetylmuramic acid kinase [Wenzhouxiangellaceae bacterium]|nr:anhydro-N-acetylmuramic acid kinase [Wenzhouxiangellaceae bacterium]